MNKSDPHSFLIDLHILEEIIPENKHQPVKANPDDIMNKTNTSPQYLKQVEKKTNEINDDEDNGESTQGERSVDDAWRNFITTAKQNNLNTIHVETKQVSQR